MFVLTKKTKDFIVKRKKIANLFIRQFIRLQKR